MNSDLLQSQPAKYQATEDDRTALRVVLGANLKENEPLARHATYRVGGPADFFLKADNEAETIVLIKTCRQRNIPLLVLGNGSNMLISDKGFRGMVILNRLDSVTLTELEDGNQALLKVGSGALLGGLSRKIARLGWAGFEFAATIPGSVGGGIVSNAGAHGGDFSQVITRVAIASVNGEVSILDSGEMRLNYRESRWRDKVGIEKVALGEPGNEFILWAEFLLHRADPAQIKAKIDEMTTWRREKQPQEPNGGSVFKNPPQPHPSAGSLIEQAGLKGHRLGGAQISPRHANFIVNIEDATATDVMNLIKLAQATVQKKYGVALELENELMGDWD